ncbi:hypothetical protein HBI75_017390 [Parastagonospora nodorum]|nr:hypothetical protein HBI75_017390 [Parastagonospora nodorum]
MVHDTAGATFLPFITLEGGSGPPIPKYLRASRILVVPQRDTGRRLNEACQTGWQISEVLGRDRLGFAVRTLSLPCGTIFYRVLGGGPRRRCACKRLIETSDVYVDLVLQWGNFRDRLWDRRHHGLPRGKSFRTMMDTRQVRSRTISNLSGAAVLIICFCFYVLEMLKVGPLSSWLCSLIVAHLGKDDWQVGRFLTDGPPSCRVRDLVLQYPQPHRRLLVGPMHRIIDASEKELPSLPERRLQAGHAASSATIRLDLISRCRWRKRRYCESVAPHKVPRAMFSHTKTLSARGPCSTV